MRGARGGILLGSVDIYPSFPRKRESRGLRKDEIRYWLG